MTIGIDGRPSFSFCKHRPLDSTCSVSSAQEQQSTGVANVRVIGRLEKKPSSGKKGAWPWQRRFFFLTANVLEWYKNEDSTQPQNHMCMTTNSEAIITSSDPNTAQGTLTVTGEDDKGQPMVLLLRGHVDKLYGLRDAVMGKSAERASRSRNTKFVQECCQSAPAVVECASKRVRKVGPQLEPKNLGSEEAVRPDGVPVADTLATPMTDLSVTSWESTPDAVVPAGRDPLFTKWLPGTKLSDIQEVLDAAIEECWKVNVNAEGIESSAWRPGMRIPGTHIRTKHFQMPPPPDLPKTVHRVLKVPHSINVQCDCRLRTEQAELNLTLVTTSFGIPFCDTNNVVTMHSFCESPGGVTFRKWVDVNWLKEVPWYLTFVKVIVESKAKQKSIESGEILSQIIMRPVT